jgi:membrane protein
MINRIKATFNAHPHTVYIRRRLSKVKVGDRKVPLLIFLAILFKKLNNDDINVRAKSITYDFFLSIFPGIIFLFTLIPYIPIANLDKQILSALADFLPASIFASVESTLTDIIAIPRKGLLSFGFLFAFYAANNGIISVINTFNHCYKTKDERSFFSKLLVSTGILFLLFLVVVGGGVLAWFLRIVYDGVEQGFDVSSFQLYFLIFLRLFVMFFLIIMSISVIYYIAPSVHKRWKFFSLGSVTASILCFVFTLGFGFYIEHFNSYNKLYGSIGALIGFLLLVFVNILMLLVGFQINASLNLAQVSDKK